MNKSIHIVIYMLLVGSLFYLAANYFSLKGEVQKQNAKYVAREEILRGLIIRNIVANSKKDKIDTNIVVFSSDGTATFLKENIQRNRRIIFRIPSNGCKLCYENELILLENSPKDIVDKILIISDYKSTREALVFAERYNEKLLFSNIRSGDYIFKELDILNIPYYIEFSDSLDINNIFIPDKEFNNLSEYYLQKFPRTTNKG